MVLRRGARGYPALWEHKALKDKSWQDLVKRGLAISKPLYAAQVALYQGYMPDLAQTPALFTALNKDTEELYHELVPFDAALAQSTSSSGFAPTACGGRILDD